MSELSDSRVRGEESQEETRGPETIKPGNGRAGGGAGYQSAQMAGTCVVCTISGNTAQQGMRRTIFSHTVSTDAISTVSGNAVSTDAISTVSGNAVSTDAICTISGKTIDVGVGRTVFGDDGRVHK